MRDDAPKRVELQAERQTKDIPQSPASPIIRGCSFGLVAWSAKRMILTRIASPNSAIARRCETCQIANMDNSNGKAGAQSFGRSAALGHRDREAFGVRC
jgi:hypothetical protein